MAALPQNEAETLAREQQDWRRKRDENASAAARESAGNPEQSAEYTRMQAKATKDRAYELLERYKDRI